MVNEVWNGRPTREASEALNCVGFLGEASLVAHGDLHTHVISNIGLRSTNMICMVRDWGVRKGLLLPSHSSQSRTGHQIAASWPVEEAFPRVPTWAGKPLIQALGWRGVLQACFDKHCLGKQV